MFIAIPEQSLTDSITDSIKKALSLLPQIAVKRKIFGMQETAKAQPQQQT